MSYPGSPQASPLPPPPPPPSNNNLIEDLLSAASSGDLSLLQSLLTPHHELELLNQLTGVAARAKQAPIVAYCITLGVDLESWDVLKGVLNGKSLDVYRVVVPAGYNINHDFDYAGSALIYAAGLDGVPLAEFLLDNGASVDRHHQTGRYSALAVAAKRAGTEMADLLISRAAAIDKSGAIICAAPR